MTEPKAWPSQAYLDVLRPEVGWTVHTAILASYSADLTSIGAALLALAGRDDDRGSGGSADLAEAIEELRGKVRIVIQRGRLAKLKRLPPVAGILDQFLVEVPFDEAIRSWHPKLALVRFTHPEAGTACRLWLGSRNLTTTENLDLGLVLNSVRGGGIKGKTIEGLESLARRLAEEAHLPGVAPTVFASQISQMRWKAPAGLKVRSVRLTSGSGDGTWPPCPARLEEVVVVSPFLSTGFVGTIGRWGEAGTRRTLFSTHDELRKLASQAGRPLRGYADRILAFDGPLPEAVEPEVIETGHLYVEAVEAGAEDDPPLGLHAKILTVRCGGRLCLWVGSANATERAWLGHNVEVIAELEAEAALVAGIEHLLNRGRPLTEVDLASEPVEPGDAIRDRLDAARKQVTANWSGGLLRDDDAFSLISDKEPHARDLEITLEAGLATSALHAWPPHSTVLDLGRQPLSLQTELVQFRLSLDGQECAWLQRCLVTPPLDEGRDRAALARHLGPRAFLDWMRGLLQGGEPADEAEEPWDRASATRAAAPTDAAAQGESLTLEDMLSCWARDPKAFELADHRMRAFLDPIIADASTMEIDDLARLQELRRVWDTLSTQLLGGP